MTVAIAAKTRWVPGTLRQAKISQSTHASQRQSPLTIARAIAGGSTGVNIAFGESVTDLRLSDLSTTAGTLSLVTGSGTSWAATLTFPATGSGTATVSLAEDSTTPQNASSSATIDYAEAAVALWH